MLLHVLAQTKGGAGGPGAVRIGANIPTTRNKNGAPRKNSRTKQATGTFGVRQVKKAAKMGARMLETRRKRRGIQG